MTGEPIEPGPGASQPPALGHPFGLRSLIAGVCGVMLLAMMGLTVTDVIGRYVFNAPVMGATELTEILLVSTIFIGLPAVSLDDEQVTVDLAVSQLPGWFQPWRRGLLAPVTAVVLAVVAWRLWIQADQLAGYNAVTNSLRLPVAPVARLCAVSCGGSVLIVLYVALRDLMQRRG